MTTLDEFFTAVFPEQHVTALSKALLIVISYSCKVGTFVNDCNTHSSIIPKTHSNAMFSFVCY